MTRFYWPLRRNRGHEDREDGRAQGISKEEADKKPGANAARPEDDPAVKECLAHLDTFLFTMTLPQPVEGKYIAEYQLDPIALHVGKLRSNRLSLCPRRTATTNTSTRMPRSPRNRPPRS